MEVGEEVVSGFVVCCGSGGEEDASEEGAYDAVDAVAGEDVGEGEMCAAEGGGGSSVAWRGGSGGWRGSC